MNEEEVHLTLHFSLYSLLQQLLEGEAVEDQSNDEEDDVDNDGQDLRLTEHHVGWRGEVAGDVELSCITVQNENIVQIFCWEITKYSQRRDKDKGA